MSTEQSSPTARLYLPPLFPYQTDLLTDTARDVLTVSSTQVGKSFAMACWIAARMWEYRGPHPWWWVAPSYKQAQVGMRLMKQIFGASGAIKDGPMKTPPYMLRMVNGAELEFRTWDDPSNLMGTTIAGGVVDEAGLLTPSAQAAISSRRSGTMGPLRYIGNPGLSAGPFRKLCSLAEEARTITSQWYGVYSLHHWTWRDKYNALGGEDREAYGTFIEQERASQPEYEFLRLYEAEWTSDDAAVFRGVRECTEGAPNDQPNGDTYVIGVDVAQQVDYLVAVVMGVNSRRAVYMDRFRGIGYPQAAMRLQELQQRFSATVLVEANGPGVALIQEFDRIGVPYVPFTTTSASKQEVVMSLANEFQNQRISLADMPPLQYELEVFRYNRLPSGGYRYEAPAGEHDDCVMALAFASWARSRAVSDYGGWL